MDSHRGYGPKPCDATRNPPAGRGVPRIPQVSSRASVRVAVVPLDPRRLPAATTSPSLRRRRPPWLRSPSVTAFVDQFERRFAISGRKGLHDVRAEQSCPSPGRPMTFSTGSSPSGISKVKFAPDAIAVSEHWLPKVSAACGFREQPALFTAETTSACLSPAGPCAASAARPPRGGVRPEACDGSRRRGGKGARACHRGTGSRDHRVR